MSVRDHEYSAGHNETQIWPFSETPNLTLDADFGMHLQLDCLAAHFKAHHSSTAVR